MDNDKVRMCKRPEAHVGRTCARSMINCVIVRRVPICGFCFRFSSCSLCCLGKMPFAWWYDLRQSKAKDEQFYRHTSRSMVSAAKLNKA